VLTAGCRRIRRRSRCRRHLPDSPAGSYVYLSTRSATPEAGRESGTHGPLDAGSARLVGAVRARPKADTGRALTAQEKIALRARDGADQHQIGVELFLSARTVEWHLPRVFAKIGITSRTCCAMPPR
jgi:DNA-binding CsgD family transcriptional regulator